MGVQTPNFANISKLELFERCHMQKMYTHSITKWYDVTVAPNLGRDTGTNL